MNEREGIKDSENGRDPAEIERDIDRTRARLGRTVDRLEQRLSPGELVDQLLGTAREQGGEFAANLGRSVRNNPMPVILTGVGLAWMMASSNEPRAASQDYYGSYDDLSGDSGDAKSRMKEGLSSAKAKAGEITGRVSDGASRAKESLHDLGGRARDARYRLQSSGERLRDGFDSLMQDQPLLVGAIGVALGAALGALLPHTEAEDRLLGETRDSAARTLKDRAADTYEEVKDKAADVVSSGGAARGRETRQNPSRPDRDSPSAGPQYEGTQGAAGTSGTAAGDSAWRQDDSDSRNI